MYKTQRIPEAIRIFACSLIVRDLFEETIYMVTQLILLSPVDVDGRILRSVRLTSVECCIFISALTTAMLSLERASVLYFQTMYIKYSGRKTFLILSLLIWIADEWVSCKLCVYSGLTFAGRIIFWAGYTLLSLGILVPNLFIMKGVRSHLRHIAALNVGNNPMMSNRYQVYKSTITVTVNGLSFMLLNLPMITVSLIVHADTEQQLSDKTREMAFTIAFMFIHLHCFVNAVNYIWRLQECRVMFIETVLYWNTFFRRKAEEIRAST
ncbi:hypothetical protein ACJMK2_018914 [Sinanodonta woodiana]|uniref:G-protein coupled receptors family 1 profile domain-containing protein n=1 Tax=Sinanodonta woodiana TaxID=1069815 RepID=A0ABD3UEU0_SINWO